MRWLPFLVSLLLGIISTAQAEERIALVVGHNLGSSGTDPLRFAEADAERVFEVLTQLGGFSPDSELLLGPNLDELREALDRLQERIARSGEDNVTALFYFAGHGDLEALHLANRRLQRSELLERIQALPVDLRLIVLDACQTPIVGQARGVSAASDFDIGTVETTRVEGTVVISSSQAGAPALESESLGGALFTHYFVSALRGVGDTNGDGRVTLLEGYEFAYQNTVRRSAGSSAAIQRPQYELVLAGSGEVVLTSLAWSQSNLLIPPAEETRLIIYQQRTGSVVAEVTASSERTLNVAVPSGTLLIQSRSPEGILLAEVHLGNGDTLSLGEVTFQEQPYELVALRGGRFELHPYRLSVSYGAGGEHLPSTWLLRHGPCIQFQRLWQSFGLGLQISGGHSFYRSDEIDSTEWLGTLAALLSWRFLLGPTDLELQGGPLLRLIHQERTRLDAERLATAGIDSPPRTRTALGGGGMLAVVWRIPIDDKWAVRTQVTSTLAGMEVSQEGQAEFHLIPAVSGAAGLELRF